MIGFGDLLEGHDVMRERARSLVDTMRNQGFVLTGVVFGDLEANVSLRLDEEGGARRRFIVIVDRRGQVTGTYLRDAAA